jgi:galactokinase
VKSAPAPEETVISIEAPGRVEILGNHTDYNEGVVLAAAINRAVRIRGIARDDGRISLRSTAYPPVEVAISQLRRRQGESRWANYPLGVVRALLARGVAIRGFSAAMESDLPTGIGLGSSAALGVATAFFLLKLHRYDLPPLDIAKVCQQAEHRFAGVESGLLDQVTSIFGKAGQLIFFDCRTQAVRTIAFPDDLALIVADSGTKRQLAASKYNLRREETRAAAAALGVRSLRDVPTVAALYERRPDFLRSQTAAPDATVEAGILWKRAMHIIGENERVWRAIELLECGDSAGLGDLMNASHESSRVNFENSTPKLDHLVDLARKQPGVLGSRLTGGGFGGAIIVLCAQTMANEAARNLASVAAQTFVSRPADGALARN